MLGSTWIVRSFLPMIKQLDRDLMNEKGKGRQPSEDVSGDVEMQALGGEEDDAFLPTNQDEFKNLQRNDQKGKGTATEEDEEEKWTKLGFHPTSTTPQEPTLSSTPPDVELASALQQAMCFINANGEGSSSGPAYSAGDSLDERDLGIPITLLPGTANPWWAERSSAEIQLQRRNSESRKLAGQSEQDGPTKEGRAALLREELMGAPAFREHRNSWEQYNNQDEGKTNVSRPNEGKGKGKEKETPHKEDKKRANNDRPLEEPTFELPSGIDLSVDYKFTDGLAYPLLPIRDRQRKGTTTPTTTTSEPPSTPNNTVFNKTDDIAYPFPITSPTPTATPHHSSPLNPNRQLPPLSGPKTPANTLTRFYPTHQHQTPPQPSTPNRQLHFQPQTPPPSTSRGFTFSSPTSPYAASATFSPYHAQDPRAHVLLASPFSTLPPTPKSPFSAPPSPLSHPSQRPLVRIPTSTSPLPPQQPQRVLNTLSRSPRSPLPSPSPSPLPSPGALRSPQRTLSARSRARFALARKAAIGRGKRGGGAYRRLGSASELGTVREMELAGEEDEELEEEGFF